MNLRTSIAIYLATLLAFAARADVVAGFESGLTGWTFANDVSIQTAAVGLNPTEGSSMMFLTTITPNGRGPDPYYTPYRTYAEFESGRTLLGLPISDLDFYSAMNTPFGAARDFGGVAKFRFESTQAGTLTFDWNKIGLDSDVAFLSLWSETGSYRSNAWIYGGLAPQPSNHPSAINLCGQIFRDPIAHFHECKLLPSNSYNVESGWHTQTVALPAAGVYWLGIMNSTYLDSLGPSVIAIDNIQLAVPEPGTYTMVLLGTLLI